jgi:hypothetical protein
MIELIMAVGSLLLVLGVFSVIVKTYLEEFSEGTLSERKWADVQTFFTYVNRDIEELRKSLGTEETLEINTNGTIEIKSSDGTVTDSVVYSADSTGNGTISREGTVILRGNNNFKIASLELKVYENSLDGNSINSNWEYEELDDPVEISSEATSNYYVEPVISLSEGSEITGGYALRFNNVIESTSESGDDSSLLGETSVNEEYLYYYNYYYNIYSKEDYYWNEDYSNYINYYHWYKGYYHYNLKIDTNYTGNYKISVKAVFETGKYNSVTGISYYDENSSKWVTLSEVSTSSSDKSITYESTEEVYVGNTIRLKFTLSNSNGLDSDKDVSVTVDVYDSD